MNSEQMNKDEQYQKHLDNIYEFVWGGNYELAAQVTKAMQAKGGMYADLPKNVLDKWEEYDKAFPIIYYKQVVFFFEYAMIFGTDKSMRGMIPVYNVELGAKMYRFGTMIYEF